jgi:hypothetical protein
VLATVYLGGMPCGYDLAWQALQHLDRALRTQLPHNPYDLHP